MRLPSGQVVWVRVSQDGLDEEDEGEYEPDDAAPTPTSPTPPPAQDAAYPPVPAGYPPAPVAPGSAPAYGSGGYGSGDQGSGGYGQPAGYGSGGYAYDSPYTQQGGPPPQQQQPPQPYGSGYGYPPQQSPQSYAPPAPRPPQPPPAPEAPPEQHGRLGLRRRRTPSPPSAPQQLHGFTDAVSGIAESVRAGLSRAAPDTVEIEFGLDIDVTSGVAISLIADARAKAAVRIKLGWENPRPSRGGAPDGLERLLDSAGSGEDGGEAQDEQEQRPKELEWSGRQSSEAATGSAYPTDATTVVAVGEQPGRQQPPGA